MATDYDNLGERYLLTKSLPWKRFSERDTFFAAVGELRGLSVVDVACGDGFYSRQLRDAGADVVGVDRSHEMIRLAQAEEERAPRGIRYAVADAADLASFVTRSGLERFDVAVALWLLDYADSRAMLRDMCRSLARVVRPGGRMVHLGGCFDTIFAHPEVVAGYGIELEILASHGDGSRIRWTVRHGEATASAENTMWTPTTITAEFEASGFIDVRWPPALVGTEGRAQVDEAYWRTYLAHPYHAVTTATRG